MARYEIPHYAIPFTIITKKKYMNIMKIILTNNLYLILD